jgi:hypothetical protein
LFPTPFRAAGFLKTLPSEACEDFATAPKAALHCSVSPSSFGGFQENTIAAMRKNVSFQ